MTREQVIEAFTMRVDGFTYQEIANKFGISRECVQQKLRREINGNKASSKNCIYPGLVNWMRGKGFSAFELNAKAGICKNIQAFYNRLYGRTGWEMDEIKKILAFTGLTFDEAFATEKHGDG